MKQAMKALKVIGMLVGVWGAASAWGVKPGDTRIDVIAELGAPQGFIRIGSEETLYFERGNIQLVAGKVTACDLISPEDVRERRLTAEHVQAEQARLAKETRARLKVEGEAALKTMLADPEFIAAGPDIQVARWRDFMQKYPDVPVAEYYLPALKRYEESQTIASQAQRIAELEWRVQQAEYKAQTMADDAQRFWQYPPYYIYAQQPFGWYLPGHRTHWTPSRENATTLPQNSERGGLQSSTGAGAPLRTGNGAISPHP